MGPASVIKCAHLLWTAVMTTHRHVQLVHVLLVNGAIGAAVQSSAAQHIECADVKSYRSLKMEESPAQT